MLYFTVKDNKVVAISTEYDWDNSDYIISRQQMVSLDHAAEIADLATEFSKEVYIPVYRTNGLFKYDVVKAPAIGEEVSMAFNGDYYPCGTIVKISPTLKKITTSDGKEFYRVKQTGSWRLKGTHFYMVKGTHDKRNPSF